MDTLTVLREARAILSNRNRWGTGLYAATSEGHATAPESPDAARFCVFGAVGCALNFNPDLKPRGTNPLYDRVWDALQKAAPAGCLAHEFNDTRTHAEVLALFDRAIAAEEAKLPPPEVVPQATPRRRDDVGCETREPVAA